MEARRRAVADSSGQVALSKLPFVGEQNQVCESEQSSVNKDRHMKYAQSGRTSVKQGGTAGCFLLLSPQRIAQGQEFLLSRR